MPGRTVVPTSYPTATLTREVFDEIDLLVLERRPCAVAVLTSGFPAAMSALVTV